MHQDQRLLSGPSSSCFLLPFLRLPNTLLPVSAAWADRDSCPETHPVASGLQAQLPGPALSDEACAGQSIEHHSASTQLTRNREVSPDATPQTATPHTESYQALPFLPPKYLSAYFTSSPSLFLQNIHAPLPTALRIKLRLSFHCSIIAFKCCVSFCCKTK